MRPVPFETSTIPEGAQTQVLAGPDGDLTNATVAPIEVAVRPIIGDDGTVSNFETVAHFILEDDDVQRIENGERSIWYRVIGDHFHVMSLSLDDADS